MMSDGKKKTVSSVRKPDIDFTDYSEPKETNTDWKLKKSRELAAAKREFQINTKKEEAAKTVAASPVSGVNSVKTEDGLENQTVNHAKNRSMEEQHTEDSYHHLDNDKSQNIIHEMAKERQRSIYKKDIRKAKKKQKESRKHVWDESGEETESRSIWTQQAVKQDKLSREEIIEKCGINNSKDHNYNGKEYRFCQDDLVKKQEKEDPMICTSEERKQRKKEKEIREINREKKANKNSSNKGRLKAKAKYARKMLVRDYLKRMLKNPNTSDEQGNMQENTLEPIENFLRHVGRKGVYLIFALLGLLLVLGTVLMPFILILTLLLHPAAFFLGVFDNNDTVTGNPDYVKTVIEEEYTDFYKDISDFSNKEYTDGKLNEVFYADGYISNTGAVMAVYLAELCTREDYSKLYKNEKNKDIPYKLVDTEVEKKLLKQVFDEFNYTETKDIEVTVKIEEYNEDTEQMETVEKKVAAEKMTVHTLTLTKWKKQYLSSLAEGTKDMLAVLADYADTYMNGTGKGDYTALSNIKIPEGADQNLIYMAAFLKAEAGGEPMEGKIAVAYVMLNRAGGAGGNVIGVLTAPYQFSCYIPNHTVEPYIEAYANMTEEQRNADACWQAAAGAYTGAVANPIGDFRYYCNPKGCSVGEKAQWAKIRAKNTESEIIIIGNHVFCKNCW